MIKNLVLLSACLLLSLQAFGRDRIVLFKVGGEGKLMQRGAQVSHAELEISLRQANRASLSHLAQRLTQLPSSASSPLAIKKDLWIIRGAVVDLDDSSVAELKQSSEILAIINDGHRQWLREPGGAFRLAQPPVSAIPWDLKAINLDQVREKYKGALMGQGVRVGILDTGLQAGHPEFKLVTGPIVFRDFINHAKAPYDDHGHGTHVAGTIAGEKIGIAPRATLIIGKILDGEGAGKDSELFEGMQWMFDPDGNPNTPDFPRVVNNSWGIDLPAVKNDINKFVAFRRALSVWLAGGIVPVFAAGNSGRAPNGIPAGLPEAFAVGSFNAEGRVSRFSSLGPNVWTSGDLMFSVNKPDCSAPGEKIKSSVPGNEYAEFSGTSMAAPHVTGALALLFQIKPALDAFQAKQMVVGTTSKKPDPGFGLGLLDVANLVEAATLLNY